MITTKDYKFFKPINQVLNHRIVCITIRYSFYKTCMKNLSTHQLTAQTQRYMLFRNTLILFWFFFYWKVRATYYLFEIKPLYTGSVFVPL